MLREMSVRSPTVREGLYAKRALANARASDTLTFRFADQHAQHGLELRVGKWLWQKDDGAGREAVTGQFWILLGGHHHHRDAHETFFGLHDTHLFRSGNMRHHDIKDCRRVIRVVLERFVCFLAVARADHIVTLFLEDHCDQTQDGRIVVGYQNFSFVVIAQSI